MITINRHPLVVGVADSDAPEWGRHVLAEGRNAAFMDTSYLRALLDPADAKHEVAELSFKTLDASLYTSALVVAEAVRHFAKAKQVGQQWRWDRTRELKSLVIEQRRILVCSPPESVVRDALVELVQMQEAIIRLDLCDCLSMMLLDRLEHRRVLGFDDHFRAVGAQLEP